MALDPVQRAGHELDLLQRHMLIEAAVDVVDVDAGVDQGGGYAVRARVGVLVHETAGVGDDADVERARHFPRHLRVEHNARSWTISAVHEASVSTRLTSPKRVLSWWWSTLMTVLLSLRERRHRYPVDVAAVEEYDGAVGHVGGRFGKTSSSCHEAVLDRQRELLGREEHHGVLAELGEQHGDAEQRAERIAVGALVRRQQEALVVAEAGSYGLEVPGHGLVGAQIVLQQAVDSVALLYRSS